jgi:SAM-dependent methyltransferase
VGYDNRDVVVNADRPPLTTVDMNLSQRGRYAADRLLEAMTVGPPVAGTALLPVRRSRVDRHPGHRRAAHQAATAGNVSVDSGTARPSIFALPGSELAGRTLDVGCRDAVARFDRWAPDYDESALQDCLYRPVHAVVLDHCERFAPRPRHVLDLGCGTGRLLADAAPRFPGASFVGVDVSQRMLAVAGERDSLAPVRARAEQLPFADGAFDLVMATFTYRHWREPAAGIVEIGRVLCRGGVCALAVVITEPTGRRGRRRWRGRRSALPGSLGVELAEAGLRLRNVDHLHGLGPVVDVTVVIAEHRESARSAMDRKPS